MNIQEIIYNMRIRPKMYVAEFRIDYIFHYTLGLLTCYRNIYPYVESDMNFVFINNFDRWVFQWITETLKKECSFSFIWYEMIEKITDNEQEALILFYEICDGFFLFYSNTDSSLNK